MVGLRGDVLVEVEGFLKHFGGNSALLNCDCQVQEVNRAGRFDERPGKLSKGADIPLKFFPQRPRAISEPDSKDIINKSVK